MPKCGSRYVGSHGHRSLDNWIDKLNNWSSDWGDWLRTRHWYRRLTHYKYIRYSIHDICFHFRVPLTSLSLNFPQTFVEVGFRFNLTPFLYACTEGEEKLTLNEFSLQIRKKRCTIDSTNFTQIKKNALPTMKYITYNEYYLGLMLYETRRESGSQHSNTIHRLTTHNRIKK